MKKSELKALIREILEEAKVKVGDKIRVSKGPHKRDKHEVIHVNKDGSVNAKPLVQPSRIKYKQGAIMVKANEFKVI